MARAMDDVDVSWTSGDTAVATVDAAALVRGVAEGSATITARAGKVEAAPRITVSNPDRAVLLALYEANDGPKWVNSENWLTDAPLGEWYGVATDGAGRFSASTWRGNGTRGKPLGSA